MGALSYKGLGTATAYGRRNKLDQNGDYAVQVDAIKEAVSIERGGKKSYVIELTVLESDNPKIRAGEERSVTINRLDSDLNYEVQTALAPCFLSSFVFRVSIRWTFMRIFAPRNAAPSSSMDRFAIRSQKSSVSPGGTGTSGST